ncbi:MAG: PQQ-binding-like beta-propeller repeat protein [Spirochaetaceae bacterium]|jgi:hypothetical protein|nr:PQQ-binding-like beta-propeller repeat protein [Spirochaetaceae bacterium]
MNVSGCFFKDAALLAGFALLAGLGPVSCKKEAPRTGPSFEEPAPVTRAQSAEAVFVQGYAEFERNGLRERLEQGARLEGGDIIIAGDDASAELEFASLANIRMLPGSHLVIRNFFEVRGGTEKQGLELFLEKGAVLAKVQKLNADDEFYIATPNSLSAVRGTRFLLSYESGAGSSPASGSTPGSVQAEKTTLAVQEGEMAFLPSGPVLKAIQEERTADPVSAAAFEEALALAPRAVAGEEALIPGAAEGAAFDSLMEDVRNGSGRELSGETRRLIQEALMRYSPVALGSSSAVLLDLMDHVRDPGTGYSILPAALPARFIAAYSEGPQAPAVRAPVRQSEIPPKPYPAMLWEKQLESRSPVDSIDRSGRVLFVMDASGTAYGISETGSLLWEAGEAVALSGLDDGAALTGGTGLSVLDSGSGESRGFYPFNGWAGLPRSRGIPVPQGIALATPRGVTICRQENAQLIREIPVAGGIISSLILAGRELAGINGQGRIVIIDAAAGAIRLEIPSDLGTEVYTPCYGDGVVYGTNRQGRIIAVDLQTGAVRWERNLENGIRAEPEQDASRLYLWTSANILVRITKADGSDAGVPIPNVESAPLLANGKLYFGGPGGTLVSADPASGRILKTSPMPGATSARPLLVGNVLYAGTSDGRLIRLDAAQL